MASEAGARILLTEDVGSENALVSWLELVELGLPA